MKDEIERKWLVRHPDAIPPWEHEWPDEDFRDDFIVQTYLLHPDADEGVVERVREVRQDEGNHYTHTVKWPTGTRGHRHEDERVVTKAEYKALLERVLPGTYPIRKLRRTFTHAGRTFELDRFLEPEGFLALECELESLDADVEMPPWIPVEREVTDEDGWTNFEVSRIGRRAELIVRHLDAKTLIYSGPEYVKHPEYDVLLRLAHEHELEVVNALVAILAGDEGVHVALSAMSDLFPGALDVPPEDRGKVRLVCDLWRRWWQELSGTMPKPAWLTPEVEADLGDWPDDHVRRSHGLPVSRRTVARWRTRLRIPSRLRAAQREREELVPHIQAQVDRWRRRFRVLRGWTIRVIHDLAYGSQVKSVDTEHKRAVIYTGTGLPTDECDDRGVPLDYALHEVLHVALRASEGDHDGEELLVQDLSWMLTHGPKAFLD